MNTATTLTVIEAPHETQAERQSVFFAGGITHCSDWQKEMTSLLRGFNGVILNPRRAIWPDQPTELHRQIEWERRYLHQATLRLFWFAPETDCPITLFEPGCVPGAKKSLVIGVHPKFKRRLDVEIQTSLVRNDPVLASSLPVLAEQTRDYFNNRQCERVR